MPAVDRGADSVASSPHSRRCEGIANSGTQCKAWAKRDSEWCWFHAMSPAERLAAARRGGLTTAAKKREKKAGSPRSGLVPHVSLEQLLRACVEGLSATFADAGLPSEIDHQTRLLSVAALLQAFPRSYRSTPQEAASLLASILPERLQEREGDAETERLRNAAEASYIEMRLVWDSERFTGELKGLYTDDGYPPWAVAPWEDRAQLDAERRKWLAELRAGEPLVVLS